MHAPRISLINLGCAKNTVDSEVALGELLGAGFDLSVSESDSDIILINTCGFIESAREESCEVIEEILQLKNKKGKPKVIAMGCLSQRMGGWLAERFPKLDAILGFEAYGQLTEICAKLLKKSKKPVRITINPSESGENPAKNASRLPVYHGPRLLTTCESYAYLRIADGCDNRCTYCAIPIIRGSHKSLPMSVILDEAEILAESGTQELVLVAQDTTAYGNDRDDEENLTILLDNLLKRIKCPRIRVLYTHPAHITDSLLDLIDTESRICGYLDIPLQHVNSSILKAMNRHYDRKRIDSILKRISAKKRRFALRTSLITGFPGETDNIFQEMLDFVREGHFQHLGVFSYSPEPDTPAYGFEGQNNYDISQARQEEILTAQQAIAFKWLDSRIGESTEILVDRQLDEDLWEGRSEFEAPDVDGSILLKGKNILAGGIFLSCLTARDNYDIIAKCDS